MELSDGGNKGTIGRGLSGEGVRGMGKKEVALISLRNAPSMMMFRVGSVSTRLSPKKDVEELICKIGGGVSCVVWQASFVGTWGTRERAEGRSGGRGDVTFRKWMGVR